MSIFYVNSGTVATGANPSVGVPTGIVTNDLLLILTSTNGGGTIFSTPSGWSVVENTSATCVIFYKIAGASESAVTLSGGGTESKSVMVAYRGVDRFSPIDATGLEQNTSSVTSLATNTFTTNSADAYVLSFYAASPVATAFSAPASTTIRLNSAPTASVRGLLLVDELDAVAGTTTARTATTGSSVNFTSYAFSLKEATTKTVLLTTTGSVQSWAVPNDLDTTVNVHVVAIGGGAGGMSGNTGGSGSGPAGGGGGFSFSSISLSGITTAYYSIGTGGAGGTGGVLVAGGSGGQTWFNKAANTAPTLATNGALANGGGAASTQTGTGAGASVTGAIGNTTRSGGTGTAGLTNAGSGGGGGGSAGDDSSNGFGGGIPANGDGGGGGGGGTGGAGNNAATSTGGNGGLQYNGVTAGGTGGAANNAGNSGANGGGGGGGGADVNTAAGAGGAGGAGTEYTITAGGTAGSGGGGGGGGGGNNAGDIGGTGGAGGLYGGGGGGGAGGRGTQGSGGAGAQGAVILTYTVRSNTNFMLMF